MQAHGPALLRAFAADWPVVVALQARVAIGDAIGAAMGAEAVVVMIGERPGLSAQDSVGLYLTWAPRPGRTDAERPSAGDERIALKRAQAAMNYLVARGVPATKVSVNYLSGGDHVAEGGTAVGRAQNRRVEIEVFNQ